MTNLSLKRVAAFLSLAFVLSSCAVQKTSLPSKNSVLENMRLTNAHFMKKWPDPGQRIMTNIERPANIWTRGVYFEGLMALYSIDKDPKYYDYAVDWGQKHNWSLRNGLRSNADDITCGQTYIDLYLVDKKEERIKAIKERIDLKIKTNEITDWTWIDAIQMAMPVFAKFGVLYNDKTYFEHMYKMYAHTKNVQGGGLYNKAEHLWWRDKDFVPPYKEPNGDDCYWSRGNGWVVMALTRILDITPKTEAHRAEYERDLKDMLKALIPLQRTDGFWNVSLQDSTHFGGKETSGTAMFTYGMAWGINNGLIDAKTYKPVMVKAWNAMVKDAVHPDGILGYVQGTGKEPKDSQPVGYDKIPDFDDYGLGAFLLAGSEVYKMK